jgi:hypothetical protein
MTLEEFEQQVMAGLLAGDDPLLAALREQYAVATVRERERSTAGFITRYDVPAGAPAIERKVLHLDDLQIEIEGATTPADASVNVHKGRLSSLECFVYEGPFPDKPVIKAAWYYGTKRHPGITKELMAERELEELLDDDDE